jgi:hypothetical protein
MKMVTSTDESCLENLSQHPECGRWRHALLLVELMGSWPGWPANLALAVIDEMLAVHSATSLVKPPPGSSYHRRGKMPLGLTPRQIADAGVPALRTVELLNAILGDNCPFNDNPGLFDPALDYPLERAAGLERTWKLRSLYTWQSQSRIRVPIGLHAHADFDSSVPTSGTLLERARAWAEGYVEAHRTADLFREALTQGRLSPQRQSYQ